MRLKNPTLISAGSWGFFNVKGFTSVQRGGESATFLKTIGDKVSLEFELSQDINRLNGNPLLTIANDENGYDQGMQIEKSSPGFGRGTLIVRKTDYQNNSSEPQVYNDYLAGVAAGANTQVDLFEEGDYEVVLDYEIKNDVHKVGGFLFVPEASIFPDYSNYAIRFKFSVRNGNTMPFLFDAQSGSELTNESVAPNGFVIDLARSRYLNVNVKREVLTGKSFDVRSNAPAKDGDRYTDEGMYTISTENTSTGQTTEKTIYVGSDPSLKAYAAAGYSTPQIEDAVNQGAAINDNGFHNAAGSDRFFRASPIERFVFCIGCQERRIQHAASPLQRSAHRPRGNYSRKTPLHQNCHPL